MSHLIFPQTTLPAIDNSLSSLRQFIKLLEVSNLLRRTAAMRRYVATAIQSLVEHFCVRCWVVDFINCFPGKHSRLPWGYLVEIAVLSCMNFYWHVIDAFLPYTARATSLRTAIKSQLFLSIFSPRRLHLWYLVRLIHFSSPPSFYYSQSAFSWVIHCLCIVTVFG